MKKPKLSQGGINDKTASVNFLVKHLLEGGFILIFSFSAFIILSLVTYKTTDPGWLNSNFSIDNVANFGGKLGAYISDLFYWIFGYAAFLLPVLITYAAGVVLLEQRAFSSLSKLSIVLRSLGLLMLLIGCCGFLSLQVRANALTGIHLSGGIFGQYIAINLNNALNLYGALLLLFSMLLVGLTWLTGISWIKIIELVGSISVVLVKNIFQKTVIVVRGIFGFTKVAASSFVGKVLNVVRFIKNRRIQNAINKEEKKKAQPVIVKKVKKSKLVPKPLTEITKPVTKVKESIQKRAATSGKKNTSIELPELGLLDKGQPGKPMGGYSNQELESLSRQVEQNLLDFGVSTSVVAVHPGPVITRFELQLAAGIKVSRLSALAKDLARSLSVTSVRVVEIIPGKTVVGIELPNPNRAMVRLSEVLSSDVYKKAHSPLTLALGVDIAGFPMVVDLAKMPHLLVAGTTGSGKSVGINAMILSILFQATPEKVRLILVDPKMLELSVYDGIPHLLTPVVTDMREAASALRWCVAEMERRYKLMASLGVRNLSGYNTMVIEARDRGEPLSDPLWKNDSSTEENAPLLDELPYIVVVIDELADMMMVVGKKVEQLIARIAQKARAAGIHLILATQRPSVDVLTGLIKSNIPTRISFQVSSKIDSRTILDQQGAEQLLGHGDMLFLAPGTGTPLRVHGAFVEDQEVHRIAKACRDLGDPDYIDVISQNLDDSSDGDSTQEKQSTEDSDPLYDQVVEFVVQTRKASISSVQRRFKIGYNRAARLVEEMERSGLVGPLEGGFRDVLVPSGE
ncbi:MAG: DNA translocase FtsK 4TM domain-containing protein [Legionellaceae bacterium]|nr:DNA translocase FtsK 4TM domain-containing protein [Legionellaceae bacterium]